MKNKIKTYVWDYTFKSKKCFIISIGKFYIIEDKIYYCSPSTLNVSKMSMFTAIKK
jgi:hypothetical protein